MTRSVQIHAVVTFLESVASYDRLWVPPTIEDLLVPLQPWTLHLYPTSNHLRIKNSDGTTDPFCNLNTEESEVPVLVECYPSECEAEGTRSRDLFLTTVSVSFFRCLSLKKGDPDPFGTRDIILVFILPYYRVRE